MWRRRRSCLFRQFFNQATTLINEQDTGGDTLIPRENKAAAKYRAHWVNLLGEYKCDHAALTTSIHVGPVAAGQVVAKVTKTIRKKWIDSHTLIASRNVLWVYRNINYSNRPNSDMSNIVVAYVGTKSTLRGKVSSKPGGLSRDVVLGRGGKFVPTR